MEYDVSPDEELWKSKNEKLINYNFDQAKQKQKKLKVYLAIIAEAIFKRTRTRPIVPKTMSHMGIVLRPGQSFS